MARAFVSASSMKAEKASALLTAAPLTLSAWFRPASTGITSGIFGFWHSAGSACIAIEVLSTNFFAAKCRSDAAGTARATSGTSVSANVWYHVCGVFTSATSRDIYTNGGGSANNTTSVTPLSLDRTTVGFHGQGSFADGRAADCAAWNVALTANEITALAAGVSPLNVRRGSLVAYYPLQGAQSPEPDFVGANSLTLSNSPTSADHAPVAPYSRRFWPATSTPFTTGGGGGDTVAKSRGFFIGAGAGA